LICSSTSFVWNGNAAEVVATAVMAEPVLFLLPSGAGATQAPTNTLVQATPRLQVPSSAVKQGALSRGIQHHGLGVVNGSRSMMSMLLTCSLGLLVGGRRHARRSLRLVRRNRAITVTERAVAEEAAAGGWSTVASKVVEKLWVETGFPKLNTASADEREAVWATAFAPSAVIEDTFFSQDTLTPGPLNRGLVKYLENKAHVGKFVIDEISDGVRSCGFTWHLESATSQGSIADKGLRGTTFVSVDNQGRIDYLREIAEPLYKPGDSTVDFLKAIGGDNVQQTVPYEPRKPTGAQPVVEYLWKEVNQGDGDVEEVLSFFADDCIYEDFNYEQPLVGKPEVRAFLQKFKAIKSLRFMPERFSDGMKACCFTWRVEIAGLPSDGPQVRGISFYRLNDAGLISFVRDIPESALKPPPLQALAATLRPELRILLPRAETASVTPADRGCSCGADGVASLVGAPVTANDVRSVRVTGAGGNSVKTLGECIGSSSGSWPLIGNQSPEVVIFLRHLA